MRLGPKEPVRKKAVADATATVSPKKRINPHMDVFETYDHLHKSGVAKNTNVIRVSSPLATIDGFESGSAKLPDGGKEHIEERLDRLERAIHARSTRAPLDTVALKDDIDRDDRDYGEALESSADLEHHGHQDMADAQFRRALGKGASMTMGRARLDSARAGMIPAKRGSFSSLDRLEGDHAVLEDDEGGTRNVPRASLRDPAEGRVYPKGSARPDTAEERRRRSMVESLRRPR